MKISRAINCCSTVVCRRLGSTKELSAEAPEVDHRSWVNLPWGVSEDELHHRLADSYRIIRNALPKRVQSALAPF